MESFANAKDSAAFQRRVGESETTHVLDRVVMMTPENIHLNSFMYEQLLICLTPIEKTL